MRRSSAGSRPARHSITNTQTPTLEHRYLMQMRTSPKSLVKVLGIGHALSQDIKGDLRTLHDLLTISDHQFKRILSSNLSFSFEHIKKMKSERQEYTEFLSRVAAVQASKLNKASATLKDYFQLHGKAFSKIHGDNLSFAERQDLCDFTIIIRRSIKSCDERVLVWFRKRRFGLQRRCRKVWKTWH